MTGTLRPCWISFHGISTEDGKISSGLTLKLRKNLLQLASNSTCHLPRKTAFMTIYITPNVSLCQLPIYYVQSKHDVLANFLWEDLIAISHHLKGRFGKELCWNIPKQISTRTSSLAKHKSISLQFCVY